MKKPLQVGDRVKLVGFGNCSGESHDVDGRKGTVKSINGINGRARVRIDGPPDVIDWDTDVYPSQCIRLVKPRPLRTWNLHKPKCYCETAVAIASNHRCDTPIAVLGPSLKPDEMVHVREVRTVKEGKANG